MSRRGFREQHVGDRSWAERGACFDSDPDIFFDPDREEQALAVCRLCPVQEACLRYALEMSDSVDADGVWGGRTVAQRRRLRQKRREGGSRTSKRAVQSRDDESWEGR